MFITECFSTSIHPTAVPIQTRLLSVWKVYCFAKFDFEHLHENHNQQDPLSNIISIFTASDLDWPVVFSSFGENCLEDHIIETESDCKFAAERRDSLSYVGNVTNNLYPAGCFWNNYKAYFNNIIDPSKTDPEGNRGGICWRKRIYLVSIMWKIFSNHFNFVFSKIVLQVYPI